MTTETQAPEDWVLLEAAERSNANTKLSLDHWRDMYRTDGMFTALCNMIAKHEKPPVDRKLLCAQEAMKSWVGGGAGPETICIRAIELWEEGFGK
jgi:hypothetical protein